MSLPTGALVAGYDTVICDLDGVVYRGSAAVPGAVDALTAVARSGRQTVFATNNASREPNEIAQRLRRLGLPDGGWTVVTSAQAAARMLASQLPPGAAVFAVGGPGVDQALAEVGLEPVKEADQGRFLVQAVVQGLGENVCWRDLAEAGLLVRSGIPWVATNLDAVLPSESGPLPGNGALVEVIAATTGLRPTVVGKPERSLYDFALQHLDTTAGRTLACGDRLDTDIAGARAAGIDSLLVLSGIATLQDVVEVSPGGRPTYVAADIGSLLRPTQRVSVPGASDWAWLPTQVRGGPEEARRMDLTVFLRAAWAALDAGAELTASTAVWRRLEEEFGIRR